MYGLVLKAIKDLVVQNYGADKWEAIKTKAGVKVDEFVRMEPYDDKIAYDLVGAASAVLGAPAEGVLEAFGHYWVSFTAQEGYGDMLDMAGNDLGEFLSNLDMLHARVGNTYTKLAPPAFDCEQVDDKTYRLHYRSTRAGLGPMVVGLVKGLGDRFGTPCEVDFVVKKSDGADHDEFVVRLK